LYLKIQIRSCEKNNGVLKIKERKRKSEEEERRGK
jgi:hypothetical protein